MSCRHVSVALGPQRFRVHLWRPSWGAVWLTIGSARRKLTIGYPAHAPEASRPHGIARYADCGGRLGWWIRTRWLSVSWLPIQTDAEAGVAP